MVDFALNLHQQFYFQDIKLKPFSELDDAEIEIVWLMRNHPDIAKWMGSGGNISLEAHHLFMANQAKETINFNYLAYDHKGITGVVSLHRCNRINAIAWLGIYRNPFRTETGLGTKLLHTICWLAFDIAKLHTLKLEVAADNVKAIQAYRRTGFTSEGCWRDALRRNDHYIDLLLMGITESEWRKHGPQ